MHDPMGYVTRDSGEKSVHSDGVQRDRQAGKTKFTLMFPRGVPMREQLFTRVAELYTRGGEKYGDRNWENSCAPDTLDHHLEALWRHFMSFFFEENQEEDHAAAIMWNINAVELTRRNIRKSEETAVGLDDEAEKLWQAEEWLNEGCPAIHREAALDHITQVLCYTTRADIRTKAFYLLQKANGDEDLPR